MPNPEPVTSLVDTASFRAAMRVLGGGVAVITVGNGQDITGFTATAVCSYSAQPPRLLVSVDQSSATWKALQRHKHFAVNLLAEDHRAVANRFAGRDGVEGAARFEGATWKTLVTGTPVLETALAILDCKVDEIIPRYDHGIVLGEVLTAEVMPGALPLMYWQGDYRRFQNED